MLRISAEETRRLFGPSNRPDFQTNVRHRAILRKALELFPPQELETIFGTPTKLRVAMGAVFTFGQLGMIKAHYVCIVLISCHRRCPLTDVARCTMVALYPEKPPLPISRRDKLWVRIVTRTTPTSRSRATPIPFAMRTPSTCCKTLSRHGMIGLCPILQLAGGPAVPTGLCSRSLGLRGYTSHPPTNPHWHHAQLLRLCRLHVGVVPSSLFPHLHSALPSGLPPLAPQWVRGSVP